MNRIGRGTKDEKSVLTELRERIGSDHMTYWVAWKYAPDLLPKKYATFNELKDNYAAIRNAKITERDCDKFLYYTKVQNAVKWLLKKQRGARMIELYRLWYEAAKTDANALKEFMKLQDEFFKSDELSELQSILKNVDTEEKEEEYEMEL